MPTVGLGTRAMIRPESLMMVATPSLPTVSVLAKPANCSGLTDTTTTPAKRPALRMGRVNWMDHFFETLPWTGSLMNSVSRPPDSLCTRKCSRWLRSTRSLTGPMLE